MRSSTTTNRAFCYFRHAPRFLSASLRSPRRLHPSDSWWEVVLDFAVELKKNTHVPDAGIEQLELAPFRASLLRKPLRG